LYIAQFHEMVAHLNLPKPRRNEFVSSIKLLVKTDC